MIYDFQLPIANLEIENRKTKIANALNRNSAIGNRKWIAIHEKEIDNI